MTEKEIMEDYMLELKDKMLELEKSLVECECEPREESKEGWGFIETMKVSKGHTIAPYWHRIRSNPHRRGYH